MRVVTQILLIPPTLSAIMSKERLPTKKSDVHLKEQLSSALRNPPQPLEANTREVMEARFGHSFGDVLVHSDAPDTLNARAFAYENHLAFSAGQYVPRTQAGDHLIAHELAHVVQSRGRQSADLRVSEPGETLETEASRAATSAMTSPASNGVGASLTADSAGVISRSVWDWIPGMGGFSGSQPTVLPEAPGDGVQGGPFIYGNQKGAGYNFGFGQGHAQATTQGNDILMDGDHGQASATYDATKIDGHIGEWSSTRPDGTTETNIGFNLGGKSPSIQGSASWGVDGGPGAYVHGDASGPAFDVSSYAGGDGFGFGAQASVAGFNVGGGTTGTDVDEYNKFGLSEGVGAALRGSWGDTDHDGFREYGGGIDIGPVSVDMRTEDPLRSGARMLGSSLIPGMGFLADQFIDEGNFTERTANRVGLTTQNADLGTTYDVIADAAGGAYDYAADGVMSAGQGLSNAAGGVANAATTAWNALPDWDW
jgi:Domain of unknown function (DUF4157)